MRKFVTYLWLAPFMALLQGCISERDHSAECEEVLLLQFNYEMNSEYVNQFEAHVDRIVIYIFDDSGRYVTTVTEEGESLTNDYIKRIPLTAGSYDLVVYGSDDDLQSYSVGVLDRDANSLDTMLESGVTSIEDLYIELNSSDESSDGSQIYPDDLTIDHLFVGLCEGAISDAAYRAVVTQVDLIKNTNDITVNILGDGATVEQYSSTISAINGRYDYQNSVEPNHGTVGYQSSQTTADESSHSSSLRTMRLMVDSPASTRSYDSSGTITVTDNDSNSVIYEESIVDQLLGTQQYSSQEDLDREDEYSFDITVESGVVVSVRVNGWQIIDITPEWED